MNWFVPSICWSASGVLAICTPVLTWEMRFEPRPDCQLTVVGLSAIRRFRAPQLSRPAAMATLPPMFEAEFRACAVRASTSASCRAPSVRRRAQPPVIVPHWRRSATLKTALRYLRV